MKNFKSLLLVALFFATATIFGQTKITGTVVDETGEALPGASVVVRGTTNGTATDFDGKFTLNSKSSAGTAIVSFIGYVNQSIAFSSGKTNLGKIQLQPDANTLEEVVIVGTGIVDLIKDRQTPIAVSTIKAAEIQEKSGNQEFPEILRSTPSVYVTKQGGGFGDSRINLRGFDQSNTAFLLNGQPINGMEDGKMYWSNWSGVMDVANAVQVQRGLGSSKLAISSVGGTVNIVTKSTDKTEGGFVKGLVGNDAYYKGTVGYSTGKDEDSPWGVTALFTHWQGDGYNDGTKGQGQNYFVSFGYKLNEKNNLNFLITGAPQWHDNNFSKSISTYLDKGKKFNNNWGYENGQYKTERRNFYHKPVANLNWDLKIDEKSSLSTVLYASWGRGGGSGGYGWGLADRNDKYDANGQIDFNVLRDYNATVADGIGGITGGYGIRASVNNHAWYGLVSNFNLELNDNWNWNIGVDGRSYKGAHYRNFSDFLGLNGFQRTSNYSGTYTINETFNANPWDALLNSSSDRKQRHSYDYEEKIQYIGGFTQFEYQSEKMSAYVQGALSSQDHQRFEYYAFADEKDVASEKVNNIGYNIKGGINFKFDEKNNFFFNTGYYSRQPFHDNIYLNYTNDVDPNTTNEKVFGLEMGYGFRAEKFAANANIYYTLWDNRTNRNTNNFSDVNGNNRQLITFLYKNVAQVHKGLEIDFTYKPIEDLELTGYGSFGDWLYSGKTTVTAFDEDLNNVTSNYAANSTIDVNDFKVGDAAQTTIGFGAKYSILEGLKVDANWNYFADLYSDFTPTNLNGAVKLPDYDLVDFGLSYKFKVGENSSIKLRGNINNVFDEEYLSESDSNIAADSNSNNNWKGVNKNNRVYFGFGRTWNFGVTYKF